MKSAIDWAHAFLLGAIALCFSLALVALTVHAWRWDSSAVAAWVQAIGSIGAIAGAFLVGQRQSESVRLQALESEEREKAQKTDAISAVVLHAIGQANATAQSFSLMRTDVLKRFLEQPVYSLSEAAGALLNIPLHEVGPSEAVTQFASLQVVLNRMSAAVEEFKNMTDDAATLAHPEKMRDLGLAAAMGQFHAAKFAEAVAAKR
ncbi:hypothetical protein AB4Y42_02415 [Paraburkholderia sp. EG286B]|uniref:hypothetical protein n=1 Tax=Paraburkholderia sp. EG286B TaxID=3237011 RepID=UPI0034D38ECC